MMNETFHFQSLMKSSKTQAPLLCVGKLPIVPRNSPVLEIDRQCLFEANENREKEK